ncbi:thiolase family protein [Streptomyces sp. NBC_00063]|uniref:thiolase family protein n=1 Tax=Streptomyces sp. NBC_00063 TaxID=2975638 RepID=UPI003D73D8FA
MATHAIDGINVQVHHYPPPETSAVIRRLGMEKVSWQVDGGLGVEALGRAAQAIDEGVCEMALVCKVMNTIAPVRTPLIDPSTGRVSGPEQFDAPYGLGYAMQRVGLTARRWMHRYGITAEQVGWVAITQRENAMRNPHAFLRTPLTMDEYLSSRWIADPVHLLDCDYPVNGARAYLLARGDIARDLRHPPVFVRSWATSPGRVQFDLLSEELDGPSGFVETLYRDAGLAPRDMNVWMMYDGFSFWVMQWMEKLGLVPLGESGAYVEGGNRIRFDGETPVNTHGGQLSEGRLHGSGQIFEAVQQLRGNAGARQARRADYAIVSSAVPNEGAAAIFGKDVI